MAEGEVTGQAVQPVADEQFMTLTCIHHKFRRILPNLVGAKVLWLSALCF
jgi:hypothetical protein